MPLIFTLAARNLFHDRLRFVATLVGIVFSMVLVTVQMGLYLGFRRMVTTMIDHAGADLWIMPSGTKCFEDPSLLDEQQRFRALSVNGVAKLSIVIGFAQWRMPSGRTTPVFIVGSDFRSGRLSPWNLVAGSLDDVEIPGAVAVDNSYFDRLGMAGLGAGAEIREQKGEVRATHQRHPFIYHHALCICAPRACARLYGTPATKQLTSRPCYPRLRMSRPCVAG